MIHIIKDFYLTADTYQFILVKSSGKIRKDTGKEDNEVIGYYPTVEATLRALYRIWAGGTRKRRRPPPSGGCGGPSNNSRRAAQSVHGREPGGPASGGPAMTKEQAAILRALAAVYAAENGFQIANNEGEQTDADDTRRAQQDH